MWYLKELLPFDKIKVFLTLLFSLSGFCLTTDQVRVDQMNQIMIIIDNRPGANAPLTLAYYINMIKSRSN